MDYAIDVVNYIQSWNSGHDYYDKDTGCGASGVRDRCRRRRGSLRTKGASRASTRASGDTPPGAPRGDERSYGRP